MSQGLNEMRLGLSPIVFRFHARRRTGLTDEGPAGETILRRNFLLAFELRGNDGQKILVPHGVRDATVKPCCTDGFIVALPAYGSERDDRDCAGCFATLESRRRFKTIHSWKPHSHENQVWAFPIGEAEPGFSIRRTDNGMARRPKQENRQCHAGGVVFDDQDFCHATWRTRTGRPHVPLAVSVVLAKRGADAIENGLRSVIIIWLPGASDSEGRGARAERTGMMTWAPGSGYRTKGLITAMRRESGRPDSNRRRPAWEAGILPTELRPRMQPVAM